MNELLKKLIGSGRKNNLHSVDKLTMAAKNMGYSDQQIEEALGELGRISLDDDALEAVMGGSDTYSTSNMTTHNATYYSYNKNTSFISSNNKDMNSSFNQSLH